MQESRLDCYLRMVAVAAAGFVFLSVSCLAQPQKQPTSGQEDSLKSFLRSYVGTSIEDKKTLAFSAFVDLKDNGTQEVVVYLTGNGWCGSGGCTTLILVPDDSSYKILTKITITRPPIRILTTKSNGWHDIAVQVQGGGIKHAYEAKLSFDGRTYPRNPSTPPSRRLIEKTTGTVVVPLGAKGTLLY